MNRSAAPAGGDESPRYERRPASRAWRLKPRDGFGICLLAVSLLAAACFKRGVTPIRTHFNQGVYHYSHGDFEIAISEYRLALEEDPADRRARFNLAEALEARATRLESDDRSAAAEDLRREAEEHYRALLAADPDHLRASVNLAAREFHGGDPAAGEARLRAAIERHPRAALPRVALAAHRFSTDEPTALREAVTLLESAVERDRMNVDANVLLGHAYAALARDGDAAGDLAGRAREAYDRALDHEPGDVGALMGAARLEHRAGDAVRAESFARRALYVLPDLLEAHLLLADLLEARSDLEEATAHLWRARQLEDPRHPHRSREDYRRRLLDLYERLAEREGAEASPGSW